MSKRHLLSKILSPGEARTQLYLLSARIRIILASTRSICCRSEFVHNATFSILLLLQTLSTIKDLLISGELRVTLGDTQLHLLYGWGHQSHRRKPSQRLRAAVARDVRSTATRRPVTPASELSESDFISFSRPVQRSVFLPSTQHSACQ